MNLLYAEAALANLDECIEALRASATARTEGGRAALASRAIGQAINARAKLLDAIDEEKTVDAEAEENAA